MTWTQIILTALVQGVTEFLPISSSGHLILLPYFADWPDQGHLVDVMVHIGSLLAIFVYFWRDILTLAVGGLKLLTGKKTLYGLLAFFIVIGTIPAVLFGLFLEKSGYSELFRAPQVVAFNAIFYGIILYVADRRGAFLRTMEDITWRDALWIGGAQALALIPGTSRSGVTMTAARFLNITRAEAARFSFLLGLPATFGAATLVVLQAYEKHQPISSDAILTGALTFVFAFLTIAFLMRILKRYSLTAFSIYRILLGLAIFFVLYAKL